MQNKEEMKMKKIETPEMNISVFENENVITTSGGGQQMTAVDKAKTDAENGAIAGSVGTLEVDIW